MENCDMCGSKIENNECSCGTWTSKEENANNPFKMSLENFHEMKIMMISSDAPHLGVASVHFRGDFNDCEKVKEFIRKMKSRPFYREE